MRLGQPPVKAPSVFARLGLAYASLVPDSGPGSRLGTQGASTRTLGSVYFF